LAAVEDLIPDPSALPFFAVVKWSAASGADFAFLDSIHRIKYYKNEAWEQIIRQKLIIAYSFCKIGLQVLD
jgi:hypothetical protein